VLFCFRALVSTSHWFHYIISLQKSAQCNVRSVRDEVESGLVRKGSPDPACACVGVTDSAIRSLNFFEQGINYEGHPVFGNRQSVEECRDLDGPSSATS
jgi:hypothetical protein